MSDVDSFWRKRVEREEAEVANRLSQAQSGMSRHSAVSRTSFNVMGVPQIVRRAGSVSHGGRVAKSEILRVNHSEAAPALDNPFAASSASEAGGLGGAARVQQRRTAGGGELDVTTAAGFGGRGASRASSRASSMGLPPFNEITIPPSPSVAPSHFSYPATPNFSEGGTSVVDPELLERLERLEMALVEEKKARANVEQRLKQVKEEEEEKKSSAGASEMAKSVKTGVPKKQQRVSSTMGTKARKAPSDSVSKGSFVAKNEVERRRSEVRAKAIESAKEARLSTGEPLQGNAQQPLTDEEETLLRRYYEFLGQKRQYSKVKIQKVCCAFSLPTKVQATAIALFKRFLLGTSLLQHNLKVMMLTSIYVACKVEENYVSAEEFGKGMHEDASRVLNAELTLLAGLSFQLVTYSPYRSIQGFRHDVEDKVDAGDVGIGKITKENLDECVAAASKIADKQMLTDAPLMHSPGKLALAAFRSAARTLNLDGALEYVRGVENQSIIDEGEPANVSESLDAIDEMVRLGGDEPKEEVVKDIDRKLKVWRTATNNKGTAEGDGREGKRHKSASKQTRKAAHEQEVLEEAALDGP